MRSSLIWVCTLCSDLSVPIFKIITVGIFPFLNLYLILHYYTCTATTLPCHFRNIEVESKNGSHWNLLMLSDQEDGCSKSRKENPQKLTQLSSRSHPRHLVGKRTAQKDITIDTTSNSQVNSNFPNKWSPASLTFNNYFYLFLYLYIT